LNGHSRRSDPGHRTSPFNIGKRVEVLDFTPDEAAPLAEGLHDAEQGKSLLERILTGQADIRI